MREILMKLEYIIVEKTKNLFKLSGKEGVQPGFNNEVEKITALIKIAKSEVYVHGSSTALLEEFFNSSLVTLEESESLREFFETDFTQVS